MEPGGGIRPPSIVLLPWWDHVQISEPQPATIAPTMTYEDYKVTRVP